MRLLLGSFGVLFFASIGAFFLMTPILSIATTVCVLAGLMAMFALGVQVGTRKPLAPAAVPSQIAA
jgi:hypothetical protein